MKSYWTMMVCFFATLVATPALATVEPPDSGTASVNECAEDTLQSKLAECDERLATCQQEKAEAERKLAECEEPKKPSKPAKDRVLVCIGGSKSADGTHCECSDGEEPQLIRDENGAAFNKRSLYASFFTEKWKCMGYKRALEELDARVTELERRQDATDEEIEKLKDEIEALKKKFPAIAEDLSKLAQRLDALDRRVTEVERQLREDVCRVDGTNCRSEFEALIAANAIGIIRPGNPPSDSGIVGGLLALHFWADRPNSMQLNFGAGYTFNPEADAGGLSAGVDYVRLLNTDARGDDAQHRLHIGPMAIMELVQENSDANTFALKVSYQLAVSRFSLEVGPFIGVGDKVPYPGNTRESSQTFGPDVLFGGLVNIGVLLGDAGRAPTVRERIQHSDDEFSFRTEHETETEGE